MTTSKKITLSAEDVTGKVLVIGSNPIYDVAGDQAIMVGRYTDDTQALILHIKNRLYKIVLSELLFAVKDAFLG